MSTRICCYTLFDITQTGVMNRAKPNEQDIESWVHKRNTQCNFDTILQVISLRSQPENITAATKIEMTESEFEKFGMAYRSANDTKTYCWKFEFEIHHSSVFENNTGPYGALYSDCEGVPMIACNTQIASTPSFLDSSQELKNIHFEGL